MTVFAEIAALLVVAVLVSILMRLLRQPLLIGYIITGLIAGPLWLNAVKSTEILDLFSQIGVAFLLFIVGLNLTPQTIKQFGRVAIITGLAQIVLTAAAGYGIARIMGLSAAPAAYVALALTFSSTIIILKILSDRGDLDKLYGRLSVGFLLVQDIVAIFILFLLPLFSQSANNPDISAIAARVLFGFTMVAIVYILSYFLLPKWSRFLSSSAELLFLFSIAWGLGLAVLFRQIGFSIETGALMAGATLAVLPAHHEIHSRLKPLRDFFVVLFFILLGAKIAVADLGAWLLPALGLSLFVLIGKPLIMLIIMGLLGFRKQTSFQTGLASAQISEFSLILLGLGVALKHVSPDILSLVTLVGIVTIFASTYFMTHAEQLYPVFAGLLKFFEKSRPRGDGTDLVEYELLLLGANRVGHDFLKAFRKLKLPFLVVDHDPEQVNFLTAQNVTCEFGDAGDLEFLRLLPIRRIKLAVSTIPDFRTNLLILGELRRRCPRALFITVSHNTREALDLYALGAHYVIMPHFLGGHYASLLVQDFGLTPRKFADIRKKHIADLKRRIQIGHEHPVHEKP